MMDNDLDKQTIFKLGAIEAEVRAIGKQITDSIHKLSDRIEENSIRTSEKIATVEQKVQTNAEEIQKLKDWKNTIVAKTAGATSVVAIFWLIFGNAIETTAGHLF